MKKRINLPSEHDIIWYDGDYIKYSSANIPTLTHSLGYATSIFEGIRAYNGKPFKLHEHLVRLQRSSDLMGWNESIDESEISTIVNRLILENSLDNAYIKIILFLDDGSVGYMANNCKVKMAISCFNFTEPYSEAITIEIANIRKPPSTTYPYKLKGSASYIHSYLAFNKKGKSSDDVIFLTEDGYICECSGSNVFFKIGTEWLTPKPEHCLDGITAKHIVDEVPNNLGINVRYENIHITDLVKSTSSFTCGTAVGIVKIKEVLGIKYFKDRDGDREIEKIISLYNNSTYDTNN